MRTLTHSTFSRNEFADLILACSRYGESLCSPSDAVGVYLQKWDAPIPIGTTTSYSDIACSIGQPTSVRAVARTCATNPVALVIPCHRVILKAIKLIPRLAVRGMKGVMGNGEEIPITYYLLPKTP